MTINNTTKPTHKSISPRIKSLLILFCIIAPLLSAATFAACHNDLTSEPTVPLSSLNAILQERQQYADALRKTQVAYATFAASANAAFANQQSQIESLRAQLENATSQAQASGERAGSLQQQVATLTGQISDYSDLESRYNKLFARYSEQQSLNERVYELRPLDDWSSVAELEAFLTGDDTESHLVVTGNITMSQLDCEDYAMTLRYKAACIGKNIEVIFCTRSQFRVWFGRSLLGLGGDWHALNMAIVDNEYHVIDQLTDEHKHVLNLD